MNFSVTYTSIGENKYTLLNTFLNNSQTLLECDQSVLLSFITGELRQKRFVYLLNLEVEYEEFLKNNSQAAYYLYSENLLLINPVLKNYVKEFKFNAGPIGPKNFSHFLQAFSSELAAQVQKIKS